MHQEKLRNITHLVVGSYSHQAISFTNISIKEAVFK